MLKVECIGCEDHEQSLFSLCYQNGALKNGCQNLFLKHFFQSGVDGFCEAEEVGSVEGVDPVVGCAAQAELFAIHIAAGQLGGWQAKSARDGRRRRAIPTNLGRGALREA